MMEIRNNFANSSDEADGNTPNYSLPSILTDGNGRVEFVFCGKHYFRE
ncbi:MAG: hypothetical protein LBU65_17460 [Planctomycetaceae bacterium]|jgi:hypothetical protein|nr:hypothetical protein [Planctomycetaceae bacterium]